ncbi:dTDP-6-deoxy-L-talose 4-dehydrogenase (NAD(P)(+)) [Lolium rigidum]|uniref:dTDP-6-deoxy-L-talose 4-dehydrogenase (NAD(P)(+)) n=1 Tax=Lolium rigidum TaxID=89674 RepID=UPI001F5DF0FF|nr:dTDP-6-deoxy-L-talose 4-dehydrogenase (NAD(P)(+)) [Lolium rigidum]
MAPGIAPKPAAPLMAAQPKKPGHMLVLGTGFVGRYVSERLLAQGWRVSGTCTSAAKKMELEKLGMNASVFDATRSNLANLHAMQDATHLLISIPPIPGVGDPLLSSHTDLQRTLTDGNLQWLCYLSSTGVYGDCGGAWVDEDRVVNPNKESSKLRYAAEEGWLDLVDELDLSAFVLRLGGIYGPGRSALDTIAKRKSLSRTQKLRESKQYTARIHVADIYQAILASMGVRSARKIYNVVDDDPAPRAEVFAFAQSLIEKIYPDLATDSAGPDSQDRIIAGEKRVSNARLKEELGVRLVHPSYRSGLQSILDSWLAESTTSSKM